MADHPDRPAAASLAWLRLVSGAVLTIILAASAQAAGVRYLRAEPAGHASVHIVCSDGHAITVPKDPDQVEVDDIKIAPGGRAVGWLAMFPNCCTSYPIPRQLIVLSAGRRREYVGSGLPVFQWMFMAHGRRIAFEQETVHGGFGVRYELRDVASGRRLAQWEPEYGADNRLRATQTPPRWVKELNAATQLSPW